MNESKKKTINIFSPYPVKECYSRIKSSLPESPRYSLMTSDKLISGVALPKKFVIFEKKPFMSIFKTIPAMNTFQPMLRASFKTHDGSTLIHGRVGIHPFVKYTLSLCFSIWLAIPLFFLFSPYFESKPTIVSGALMAAFALCLIIVFSIIIEKLSWYYSRGESEFLKNFLLELLDAKEIKTSNAFHN